MVGHADVHQDHVRVELAGKSNRLGAILSLADDLEEGRRVHLEDQPEAAPDERLVVGDQDSDAHDASPSGIRAVTRYPPVVGDSASRVPPSIANTLAHAGQAVAGVVAVGGAVAVVADHELKVVAVYRMLTRARSAAECLSVFVSASWMIR